MAKGPGPPSWLLALVFLVGCLFGLTRAYLAVLSSSLPAGTVVFEAGVPHLGGKRKYQASSERTAWFALKLLKVHPHTGRVSLARSLSCDGLQYPRVFTFYIDSTSSRLGRATVDYYSLPLRVFVAGCPGSSESDDLAASKSWTAETLASYAMPSNDKFTEICLRSSQLIAALRDFLPHTALKDCETRWGGVADPRFLVEGHAGDLVSASEQCLVDPLWKISVSLSLRCTSENHIADAEHRLKIVFHHQQLDDTDLGRRVRRELRNQSPFFEQALYMAAVDEEREPGLPVTVVKARDPEGGAVRYSMSSLLDARSQGLFNLDGISGKVSTTARLDREHVDVHYFRVLAVDDSFPPRTGTTTLQINVLDANDHAPIFESHEYEATVHESVPLGSSVVSVKAADQDMGKNAEIEYTIVSTSGGGTTTSAEDASTFRIDPKSGLISTRSQLDREKTEVYTVIIQAADLASPPALRQSASATLVVKVLDDNDNYPQFSERTYVVSIPEDLDYTTNPTVAQIRATDADAGGNSALRYAIIGGNTQNTFSIDSQSGDVNLVKPLDYETVKTYKINVRAQDGGMPAKSNTTQLLVKVRDVNDNSPRFHASLFHEAVSESVPVGYSMLKVQAYDADEGDNAQIKYSLGPRDLSGASITDSFPVAVNCETGWIFTVKQLDREQCSKYQFTVIASDAGDPPRSSSATVILTITDVNDNDPYFEPKTYDVVVSENDPPGTAVTTVVATDSDEDGRLRYEITSGNTRGRFSITSQNGRGLITIAQSLDYKQEKRFVLTVTASDTGGRSDTAQVYVNVSDANNFNPVFENAPYSVSVFEDAPVGTTVLVVSASDADVGQNAQITYSLGSPEETPEFAVNPQTGAITTTRPLDRETVSGYLLTVTAKDGGLPSLSDTTDVEIAVTDVNDNAPVFDLPQYQGSVIEDTLIGTSVLKVTATDVDIGLNGRVQYHLENDGDGAFSMDSATGVVRTAKALDRESVARYNLKAIAVDRGSPALSSTVAVVIKIDDINDSPPAFESEKLTYYIPENSPIGSTVHDIYAPDPDEGPNAIVQYAIIGGEDANSFSLNSKPGSDRAELITLEELDYESPKKKFELVIRAASPPLRTDVIVQVLVTDVNDNAPKLEDFQVVFNNFKDYFPNTPIGRVPAFDADVTDKLLYTILSGNNANLVLLNRTTGDISLSPQLNTNVPRVATMEISVTDGINEAKATMTLSVRLVTNKMLFNSITVRLDDMTAEAFLSPLLNYFVDGLAAIVPCPRENIFIFSIQEDGDVRSKILNVSFSAKKVEPGTRDEYYSTQYLQERVYLNRGILARLANVKVLPFNDNLCVREPCLNFEECLTVLKFGNASGFASSNTVLFRPIYPLTTFVCRCAKGFTGSREAYLCDTEVNLCYSNPCKNSGTCHRREGGYTCQCLPGFTGTDCEIATNRDSCSPGLCGGGAQCVEKRGGGFTCENCPISIEAMDRTTPFCQLRARSFTSETFLTFPSLKQRYRFHLSLKFATESTDALLLYNGRYNEKHDFIALEIVESQVQFSFSLGEDITRAVAEIPGGVADGNWHEVEVSFVNRSVIVSLDHCDVSLALRFGERLGEKWSCASRSEQLLDDRCNLATENCHRFLDLTGPMQLGGLPAIPSNFQIRNKNYVGCMSDLYIDHQFVDLNAFVADNGTVAGCPEKRAFCDPNPCSHDGKCQEIWSGFVCECQEGYGGPTCDEVSKPWNFRGDGLLSFNPLLKQIQLPWMTGFSLRTREQNAFVMTILIGQNSSIVFELVNGRLVVLLDDNDVVRTWTNIADGEWHRVEVVWQSGQVSLEMNYRSRSITQALPLKLQGLIVGRILIGGVDRSFSTELPPFNGCLQDVRIGTNQTGPPGYLTRPTLQENVGFGCNSDDTCQSQCLDTATCVAKWQSSECVCKEGRVGKNCEKICDVNPCSEGGVCVEKPGHKRGYQCKCRSEAYSGEYCEVKAEQPCPATWWGTPVCGPCHCDEEQGYDPACNKTTGECYCKENHYQPPGRNECIPCNCYSTGSFGPRCDMLTGQCRCRAGVIGRTCTDCPNPYAEVTLKGCEVIYDGCPRSFSDGIWWSRTKFGSMAVEDCPGDAEGRASRSCDDTLGGWQAPDLFNCTSEAFIELREQLHALKKTQELTINTYVAVKMASELYKAVNTTQDLYGADLLVAESLLSELLKYEESLAGLNLTHSQDKDYVSHLVNVASAILRGEYLSNWVRIGTLDSMRDSPDKIMTGLSEYLKTLAVSQHDTFTSPFEVVTPNVVLGLDVVTSESLFGYEPAEYKEDPSYATVRPFEADQKVVLPDTSTFFETPIHMGPSISFPKYNNYMPDPSKFDPHTKVQVPLSLLGIKSVTQGDLNVKNSLNNHKAVLSYVQYRQLGTLMPQSYDQSVTKRWGVEIGIGSPIITVSVLVPSEAGYDSLTGIPLKSPVRVQMWLSEHDGYRTRVNPQCVHWSTTSGVGVWSRLGCTTEIDDSTLPLGSMVNCSCIKLSTFAVLTDVLDPEYVPEPSLLEDVTSYTAFIFALPMLFTTIIILGLIRGGGTNSNSIHKNLIFCVFMSELLYLVALKGRSSLVGNDFACKLIAIGLHYSWLSTFAWTLVDSIHLYRMLTEIRDVNHGQMSFYYTLGFGMSAVIVGLTTGVRADQYGNFYFCWLSIYETVIWSLIGPICAMVAINFFILILSVRAAFTLKEHIMGFGNLRTLLWLSVASLPLLGTIWTLAVLAASENSPTLMYMLSMAIVAHAGFSLVGYCFVNGRVRRNLYLSMLKCIGKKAPLIDASTTNGNSSPNASAGMTRTALVFSSTYPNNDANSKRGHLGISTSSTTSQSTNKTSSSPYRSDQQLRNTSTSTSNYNSDRGIAASGGGVAAYLVKRARQTAKDTKNTNADQKSDDQTDRQSVRQTNGRESESDADSVSQRENRNRGTMENGSSPSSQDDLEPEVKRKSSLKNTLMVTQEEVLNSYLSDVPDEVPEPPPLNTFGASTGDLFPNIKPLFAPRWSSQLPDAYMLGNTGRLSQWSGGTISDNEMPSSNTISPPNPLSYHEISMMQSLRPDENFLDAEDKLHLSEKYMFPYSGEEEIGSPTPYMLPMPTRIISSSLSHHSQGSNHNDVVYHSGSECYGSLKRGHPPHHIVPPREFNTSLNGLDNSRFGSLTRGSGSLHGSYHDNLNLNNGIGHDRFGSLKRHANGALGAGKLTPTLLAAEDTSDYSITPISARMQQLTNSLGQDLQYSNELAALRQLQMQQQQLHYEQTIAETEKDSKNAETTV